jgi:hypothetical protein
MTSPQHDFRRIYKGSKIAKLEVDTAFYKQKNYEYDRYFHKSLVMAISGWFRIRSRIRIQLMDIRICDDMKCGSKLSIIRFLDMPVDISGSFDVPDVNSG